MNENEFEYEGLRFIAIESVATCDGCAGIEGWKHKSISCLDLPECISGCRVDNRNVIFIEVKHERE